MKIIEFLQNVGDLGSKNLNDYKESTLEFKQILKVLKTQLAQIIELDQDFKGLNVSYKMLLEQIMRVELIADRLITARIYALQKEQKRKNKQTTEQETETEAQDDEKETLH